MKLQTILQTVADNLRHGNLKKEAQVKQAVILPVLRALDWDDTNPNEFTPEYSVNKGSVDYALLNNNKPYVFIEAKNLGCLDDKGEEQLFGYASNQGIPLLILTDGNRWDFYLSMAAGPPEERRFYRLELKHVHKFQEYEEFLENCLQKNRVVSGVAKQFAEDHHESNKVRAIAKNAIPNAWLALLKEPDELICDLLVEKVESECGTKPENDDVQVYLRKIRDKLVQSSLKPPPPKPPSLEPQPSDGSKIVGFVLGGHEFNSGSAIGTLAEILVVFDSEYRHFMERFAEITATKNRNLVAKHPKNLYLAATHLEETHSRDLGNGWWLATNHNKSKIKEYIEIACGVAGVKFSIQLNLIEK